MGYEKGFKKVFYSRYKDYRVEFVRRVGIRARETNNEISEIFSQLKCKLYLLIGILSQFYFFNEPVY
ncbi:MAG: hypothetical protein J7K98_04495 [Candidatus Aenigmarchaeota archaeon]|nr:hypothetical protein [Candidatus Aenigmarchaeota archaeon]